MVNFAAKRSRVPLLVNVSHSTLDGAVELARQAAGAGVAGVLLMPPHYFRHSQQEILIFYRALCRCRSRASLQPISTTSRLSPARSRAQPPRHCSPSGASAASKTPAEAWNIFPRFSNNARARHSLFCAGQERIYVQQRRAGAQGAVSGVASALPELMVALDQAIVAGDPEHCPAVGGSHDGVFGLG